MTEDMINVRMPRDLALVVSGAAQVRAGQLRAQILGAGPLGRRQSEIAMTLVLADDIDKGAKILDEAIHAHADGH